MAFRHLAARSLVRTCYARLHLAQVFFTMPRASRTRATAAAATPPPAPPPQPTIAQQIQLEELAVQKAQAEAERVRLIAKANKRGSASDSDDDDGGRSGRVRARKSSTTHGITEGETRAGRRDERDVQTCKDDAAGIVDELSQHVVEKFNEAADKMLDKVEARFEAFQTAVGGQLDATSGHARDLRRAIADVKTATKDEARERSLHALEELVSEQAEGTRRLAMLTLKKVAAALKAVAACTEPPRARGRPTTQARRPRSRSPFRARPKYRSRKRSRSRSRSPRHRSGSRERQPLRCFDCYREGKYIAST